MRLKSPRGTQDILPAETPRWRYVENTFRKTCAEFGYQEIRTPIYELTKLFVRAVGEHTDIVSKEMFTVIGREGESSNPEKEKEEYVLRPEGTAPALRAYIQHNLGKEAPMNKLYYVAPNFRCERPQKGRYRQHHQTGIEALGSEDPGLDAEVIVLGLTYLHRLGITGEQTEINTVGCPACRGTGYRGRAALYELMMMSEPARAAVHPHLDGARLRRQAVTEGMQPLRVAGLAKVAQGVTTLEEVLRCTPRWETDAPA